MKGIVIVAEDRNEKRDLAAVLRLLFPECEIRIVSHHDLGLHRHGLDDECGDSLVDRFERE
jgi:hypothetical protein